MFPIPGSAIELFQLLGMRLSVLEGTTMDAGGSRPSSLQRRRRDPATPAVPTDAAAPPRAAVTHSYHHLN